MSALGPGFADPVRDAQRVFRLVLGAMARPGRIAAVPDTVQAPDGMGSAAAAILLALADADVSVWTPIAAARPWLAFHAGCRFADAPEHADFLHEIGEGFDAAQCRWGTNEAPQRGATVLLEVDGLEEGRGWTLAGPGIDGEVRLGVDGLGAGTEAALADNHARYPAGFDTVFCHGAQFVALPRSTRIGEGPR